MNKPRGGRGKKVPYSSLTVRVPEKLKEKIESIVDSYRDAILNGSEYKDNDYPSIDEIIELSKILLSGNATRKQIIEKLVMSIYKIDISEKLPQTKAKK